MTLLYFDDFAAGQHFRSETTTVTADDIKAFAASFDPQPFHMDEARASDSFLGTRGERMAHGGADDAAARAKRPPDRGWPDRGGGG